MMTARQLIILIITLFTPFTPSVFATALDDYIAKPDIAYHFERYATDTDILDTTYFLTLHSQQWRNAPGEVDRPVWEHELIITVPHVVRANGNPTAILLVDGGNNSEGKLKKRIAEIAQLADLSQSVVAIVRQVPNQPLSFTGDSGSPRREDAILAYSLSRFMESCNQAATDCDWEWPVHLAMTKSVVRAMDAIQEFLATKQSIRIKEFMLTGASKRAWTIWLTAVVDKRVKAFAPISFDALNLPLQLDWHWAAYGGTYAFELQDYTNLNIFCRAKTTPAGQQLWSIIDPYAYRDRLIQPKYILNSAGDQFFLPDSARRYYRQLIGDNRLRYTFNTDHYQHGTDALLSIYTWANDIRRDKNVPNFDWKVENDKLIVQTQNQVEAVWLWQASNPNGRDFRLTTIGPGWTKQRLFDVGGGRYEAFLPTPAQGWAAYSIEVVFPGRGIFGNEQTYTTTVVVRPRQLPLNPQDHCSGS